MSHVPLGVALVVLVAVAPPVPAEVVPEELPPVFDDFDLRVLELALTDAPPVAED